MATICITGANRGIGLEMARQYTERGNVVLGLCRTPSEELTSLGVEVFDGVDVTSGESVADLASKLAGRRIAVLVNNAGILTDETPAARLVRSAAPSLQRRRHS